MKSALLKGILGIVLIDLEMSRKCQEYIKEERGLLLKRFHPWPLYLLSNKCSEDQQFTLIIGKVESGYIFVYAHDSLSQYKNIYLYRSKGIFFVSGTQMHLNCHFFLYFIFVRCDGIFKKKYNDNLVYINDKHNARQVVNRLIFVFTKQQYSLRFNKVVLGEFMLMPLEI